MNESDRQRASLPREGASPSDAASQSALAGEQALAARRFGEAIHHYNQAVAMAPGVAAYRYKLATIAWQAGQHDLVENHLLQAVRLNPDHAAAHAALSQWLLETGECERPLVHSQRAVELAPQDTDIAISRGFVLEAAGRTSEALELVDRLVARKIPSRRLALLFGRIAPKVQRQAEALAYIEWVLQTTGADVPQAGGLHLTAASLLDRMGRYDEAFEHARRGNRASARPYDRSKITSMADRRIAFFTPSRFAELPRATNTSRRPVFILGMPRSGTSLIEQILASHPQVHGAGELRALGIAMNAASQHWGAQGVVEPDYFARMTTADLDANADRYLATLTSLNKPADRVTDKMPLNFVHAGAMALLFPQARIIHCRRDARDTCVSCFMADFARGYEFCRDLSDLGAFYREYERLMAHWKTTLPVPMLEVSYEEVVQDLEGQARRLVEFIDLPWNDACLNFHENQRYVGTVSREQVRRPIYASSVGRWKHYEKHLGPLLEGLNGGK